ncbi:MAG TPA: FAD-dependent oxidoreductase [Candidatus Dormibacteraeota bacterium]|nr:FAD-dependent oxidoreductase [Candidatus Dormibacteraeota bacterium]
MARSVIVVGAGVGGLVAAIRAADLGLDVVVLERTQTIGGVGAVMGGAIWVPANHHMLEAGLADSPGEGAAYLHSVGMGRDDPALGQAFVERAPVAVRYLEEQTPLRLLSQAERPDYAAETRGGKRGGRCLVPDVRAMPTLFASQFAPALARVRRRPKPLEAGEQFQAWTGGEALVGALSVACEQRGIEVRTGTRARRLLFERGRVTGVVADGPLRADAVIIASGSFQWNASLTVRCIAGPAPRPITPPGNEGDGIVMAVELGAATALMDETLWLPVIQVPGEEIDGRRLHRPFSTESVRPGSLVVDRSGNRCYNESFWPAVGEAYVARRMHRGQPAHAPLHWVCDQAYRDRYPVGPLASGQEQADWLVVAGDLDELGRRLHLPPGSLTATVERFNAHCTLGVDPDFGRGATAYDRSWGDPTVGPNPCLAPLRCPPYYAVRLHPGTVFHRGGLVVSPDAEVLDVRERVIPGLYATGGAAAQLAIGASYTSGFGHAQSIVHALSAVDKIKAGGGR